MRSGNLTGGQFVIVNKCLRVACTGHSSYRAVLKKRARAVSKTYPVTAVLGHSDVNEQQSSSQIKPRAPDISGGHSPLSWVI